MDSSKSLDLKVLDSHVESAFKSLLNDFERYKQVSLNYSSENDREIFGAAQAQISRIAEKLAKLQDESSKQTPINYNMLDSAQKHLTGLFERYCAVKEGIEKDAAEAIFRNYASELLQSPMVASEAGIVDEPRLGDLQHAVPEIPYIAKLSAEELSAVPSYILGRLTADKVNPFIVCINRILLFKYTLLYPLLLKLVSPSSFQPTNLFTTHSWVTRTVSSSHVLAEGGEDGPGDIVEYTMPKFISKSSRLWASKFLEQENESTAGKLFFTETDINDNLPEAYPKAFAAYVSHATNKQLLLDTLFTESENSNPSRSRNASATSQISRSKALANSNAANLKSSVNSATLRNVLTLLRHMGRIKELRIHNMRRFEVGQY